MPLLHVLLVDDSKMKQQYMREYIRQIDMGMEVNISIFSDPVEGLEFAYNNDLDMILLDYLMPVMDGLEFLKSYRVFNQQTPIIMITSEKDDQNLKIEALRLGVNDFLTYPCSISEFQARFSNLIQMHLLQKELEITNKILHSAVIKATNEVVVREQETLSVLALLTEFKDLETETHTVRVAKYSQLLAQKAGLSDKQIDIIHYSAPLHDIGKLGIPDEVLLKTGKYTDAEYDVMKKHTVIGYRILQNTRSEYLAAGKEIALSHHERYDGSGYPYGKKGNEIPIQARIVSISDVFDALLSERPYKKAWPFDDVVAYLAEQKGKQFDPRLVDIFLANIEQAHDIYQSMQ